MRELEIKSRFIKYTSKSENFLNYPGNGVNVSTIFLIFTLSLVTLILVLLFTIFEFRLMNIVVRMNLQCDGRLKNLVEADY